MTWSYRNKIKNNKQLTLLFNCFNESFNHFIKSGDGATGVSSALGGGITFAGGADERAIDVVPDPLDGTATGPVEGGIGSRPTGGVAMTAAVVFPLAPTVVHAPPVEDGVAYSQDIKSGVAYPSNWDRTNLVHGFGICTTRCC